MASPSSSSPNVTPARRERLALCDLFEQVGPDAPTLSGEWTTRDLAAHLVVREGRPDAAAGLVIPPLSGYTDKVQQKAAGRDYGELVAAVRDGPPSWSPLRLAPVERQVNTIEYFVHHEDVRRAAERWDARQLDQELRDDLRAALSKVARLLARSSTVGIVLAPDDTTDGSVIMAKKGEPSVTISGPVGEIVLFMYGRKDQADVHLDGDDASIAAVRTAEFSI
jgi:uncharacterized protein (TIGR03085 family)